MTATRPPSAQASSWNSTPRVDEIRDVIRRRSVSLQARTRIADVIRSIAIDIYGGEEHLSASDRLRLRQQIADAVNEATEEALASLVDELTTSLRSGSARVAPAFVKPLISRTDFE